MPPGNRLRPFTALLFFALAVSPSPAAEFSVVSHNLENLFDLDGVSLFGDYKQDEAEGSRAWSRRKLLTKLRNTAATLRAVGDGSGPDVLLLQELEGDLTPATTVEDWDGFLRKYAGTTVDTMLGKGWRPEYAGLPAAAWLLKALHDAGMGGYALAIGPTKPAAARMPHVNAVFSRFPIRAVRAHPTEQARDILEVELDVRGHPFRIFVNHWKSGASDPKREPLRVANARVLRQLLDAHLAANPWADILVAGDLNSHYNHARLFPEVRTGIIHVLGSQGDERTLREPAGPDLYNLWFELPPEERFSEVWRGRKGTLMHLLATRGLYDRAGIAYLDNSFRTVAVPGVNADALGRPVRWTFFGRSGGGTSDHLPLLARFRSGGEGEPGEPAALEKPSRSNDAPARELWFDYAAADGIDLPGEAELAAALKADEIGSAVGRLFRIEARIARRDPLTFEVLGRDFPVYVPSDRTFRRIIRLPGGARLRFTGELAEWNSGLQWIVRRLE